MTCALCSPSNPSGMNLIDSTMVPRLLMESGFRMTCDGVGTGGAKKKRGRERGREREREREEDAGTREDMGRKRIENQGGGRGKW